MDQVYERKTKQNKKYKSLEEREGFELRWRQGHKILTRGEKPLP